MYLAVPLEEEIFSGRLSGSRKYLLGLLVAISCSKPLPILPPELLSVVDYQKSTEAIQEVPFEGFMVTLDCGYCNHTAVTISWDHSTCT